MLFDVNKCESNPLTESVLVLGIVRLDRVQIPASRESPGAVVHDRAEIVRLPHVVDVFGVTDLEIALGTAEYVGKVDPYVVIAVSAGLLVPEAECMSHFMRDDSNL